MRDDMLISLRQIGYLQHALGIDNQSRQDIKHGVFDAHRNYFDAGENDPLWEDLVKRGFAGAKFDNGNWYWVNEHGIKLLEKIMLIKIDIGWR